MYTVFGFQGIILSAGTPLLHPISKIPWPRVFSVIYLLFHRIMFPQDTFIKVTRVNKGWSGGAMVLGKLPVPGRPTIWVTVGQGHTALAEGAGGGCLDIFTLFYPFFPLSPSLWGVVGWCDGPG